MKLLTVLTMTFTLLLISCGKDSQFGQVTDTGSLVAPGQDTEQPIVVADPPDGDGGTDLIVVSDAFTQSQGNSKVDIIWNIDNSGSMQNEQNALANNFDIFVNDFITKNVDFKMAITTTDPGSSKNGNIVGNSDQLLTATAAMTDEATFISDFQSIINVGTNGSGDERGLQTSNSFLDKNAGFLRQDALLVIVIVSDEEDHSNDSVANQVAALQVHNPGVKVYSIVDTQASQGSNKRGQRYMDASNATAGSIADINASFYQTLQDMGQSIVELTESFVLSQTPYDIASLKVFVEGVQQSASTYTYTAATRTVKFNTGSVPAAGSNVTVSYSVPK